MSKTDTEAGRRPKRKAARWHWYRTYPVEWTDGSASKLTLEEVGLLMILHTHAIEREGPIPGDAMLHLARQRRGNARSAKRIAQSLARHGLLKIAGEIEAKFSVLPLHAIDEIANRLSLSPDEVCAKFDESLDEVSSNISKKRNEINANFAQSKSESDTDAPPTGGASENSLIESSPAHARERARRTGEGDNSASAAPSSQANHNPDEPDLDPFPTMPDLTSMPTGDFPPPLAMYDGPREGDEICVGGDAFIELSAIAQTGAGDTPATPGREAADRREESPSVIAFDADDLHDDDDDAADDLEAMVERWWADQASEWRDRLVALAASSSPEKTASGFAGPIPRPAGTPRAAVETALARTIQQEISHRALDGGDNAWGACADETTTTPSETAHDAATRL